MTTMLNVGTPTRTVAASSGGAPVERLEDDATKNASRRSAGFLVIVVINFSTQERCGWCRYFTGAEFANLISSVARQGHELQVCSRGEHRSDVRGVLTVAVMPLKDFPPERLGDVLATSIKRMELGARLDEYGVWPIWNETVGEP